MGYFNQYLAYLKNNPQKYWFKRKLYGWGWTPARWQGWLTLAVFIAYIAYAAINLPNKPEPIASELEWYFAKIFLAATILIFICYKTGEKPKWQWGIPKEESTEKENAKQNIKPL